MVVYVIYLIFEFGCWFGFAVVVVSVVGFCCAVCDGICCGRCLLAWLQVVELDVIVRLVGLLVVVLYFGLAVCRCC